MFSRSIRTNHLGKLRPTQCMGSGDYIFGTNEAGKRARTLFNCISIMDGRKINNQNNSPIAKGALYLQTKFEVI